MITKIIELEEILKRVVKDNIISPNEISSLQDWVDENSVDFCENQEGSNIILLLQKILEDGEISKLEMNKLIELMNQIKRGN